MAIQEEHKIEGKYYIKVRLEGKEIPITPELCMNLNIVESINQLGITATFDYKDIGGFLINYLPVIGGENLEIDLGHEENDLKTYKFRIVKIEPIRTYQQTLIGIYRFTLLDQQSFKLGLDTHTRSWKNTKISNIVKNILNEYDFSSIIEETSKPLTIVQPNTTDSWFISKYLVKYAKSMNYNIGGYIFFIGTDEKFRFVSYEYLKSKKSSQTKKLTLLRTTDEAKSNRISDIAIYNNTINLYSGGYGYNVVYFDTQSGSIKSTNKKVSNINIRSLADNLNIGRDIVNTVENNRTVYNGRLSKEHNENIHDTLSEYYITKKVNNLLKTSLIILGDNDLLAGDLVNIDLPKSSEEDFSSPYSGYWIVNSITRNVRERGNYVMRLELIREGLSLEQKLTQYNTISAKGGRA